MMTDVVTPEIVELPPELECLTPKQRTYVLAYGELGSKVDAYRRAYDTSRMNEKTVHNKALVLSRNVKVIAAVEFMALQTLNRHVVTVDKLVEEMAEAAFADPGDFIDISEDGRISINFARMPQALKLLCSVEQEVTRKGSGKNAIEVIKTRIKWLDKQRAQEMLARHLGMFSGDGPPVDKVTFIFKM